MAARRTFTIAQVREILEGRRECDDPVCPGWDVFESGRGLEIQRCDTCCPKALGDDDVARLPEAKRKLRAAKAFGAVPRCPRDGNALRMCRFRDPARMHCDVCDWCGDPSRPQDFAKAWARRSPGHDPIECALAAAERHGREGDDPDHEVGDLQELVRLLARRLGREDVSRALRGWTPWRR